MSHKVVHLFSFGILGCFTHYAWVIFAHTMLSGILGDWMARECFIFVLFFVPMNINVKHSSHYQIKLKYKTFFEYLSMTFKVSPN